MFTVVGGCLGMFSWYCSGGMGVAEIVDQMNGFVSGIGSSCVVVV